MSIRIEWSIGFRRAAMHLVNTRGLSIPRSEATEEAQLASRTLMSAASDTGAFQVAARVATTPAPQTATAQRPLAPNSRHRDVRRVPRDLRLSFDRRLCPRERWTVDPGTPIRPVENQILSCHPSFTSLCHLPVLDIDCYLHIRPFMSEVRESCHLCPLAKGIPASRSARTSASKLEESCGAAAPCLHRRIRLQRAARHAAPIEAQWSRARQHRPTSEMCVKCPPLRTRLGMAFVHDILLFRNLHGWLYPLTRTGDPSSSDKGWRQVEGAPDGIHSNSGMLALSIGAEVLREKTMHVVAHCVELPRR